MSARSGRIVSLGEKLTDALAAPDEQALGLRNLSLRLIHQCLRRPRVNLEQHLSLDAAGQAQCALVGLGTRSREEHAPAPAEQRV